LNVLIEIHFSPQPLVNDRIAFSPRGVYKLCDCAQSASFEEFVL
jgi:hypothetical protein